MADRLGLLGYRSKGIQDTISKLERATERKRKKEFEIEDREYQKWLQKTQKEQVGTAAEERRRRLVREDVEAGRKKTLFEQQQELFPLKKKAAQKQVGIAGTRFSLTTGLGPEGKAGYYAFDPTTGKMKPSEGAPTPIVAPQRTDLTQAQFAKLVTDGVKEYRNNPAYVDEMGNPIPGAPTVNEFLNNIYLPRVMPQDVDRAGLLGKQADFTGYENLIFNVEGKEYPKKETERLIESFISNIYDNLTDDEKNKLADYLLRTAKGRKVYDEIVNYKKDMELSIGSFWKEQERQSLTKTRQQVTGGSLLLSRLPPSLSGLR